MKKRLVTTQAAKDKTLAKLLHELSLANALNDQAKIAELTLEIERVSA